MSDAVQQISDLMFRYAELFDTGQFDEFAALFEHGQWHKAEPGAAAARQWITDNVRLYDSLTHTKHVTTNVVVDVDEDAGTATATAYVTIFQALPDFPLQPIFSGRYQDRLSFNAYLRGMNVLFYLAWCLGIASNAASGVVSEREEDTWTSLTATPLSGVEILRAKNGANVITGNLLVDDGEPLQTTDFGLRLRQFRLRAGMSRFALAQAARVSASYVASLENGHREMPRGDILWTIADALNMSVDQLLGRPWKNS